MATLTISSQPTTVYGLTPQQSALRDALVADLRVKGDVLNDTITAFNDMLASLGALVRDAIDDYNASVAAGYEFVTEIIDTASVACETQDSVTADLTNAWIDQWHSVVLSDVDVDVPGALTIEVGHATALADLPAKA
jgi:hypothetical protein